MAKVFLGGPLNKSTWRKQMIKYLKERGINYFNPVVEDWTPDCQEEELRQREVCDFVLYTITPKMKGVYSVAEVVDDSNKRPDKTIFVLLEEDGKDKFDDSEKKSIESVATMVDKNGTAVFRDLEAAADWIKAKTKQWKAGEDLWSGDMVVLNAADNTVVKFRARDIPGPEFFCENLVMQVRRNYKRGEYLIP